MTAEADVLRLSAAAAGDAASLIFSIFSRVFTLVNGACEVLSLFPPFSQLPGVMTPRRLRADAGEQIAGKKLRLMGVDSRGNMAPCQFAAGDESFLKRRWDLARQ